MMAPKKSFANNCTYLTERCLIIHLTAVPRLQHSSDGYAGFFSDMNYSGEPCLFMPLHGLHVLNVKTFKGFGDEFKQISHQQLDFIVIS